MKKEMFFLVSAFFFMSMTAITVVYAVEEEAKEKSKVIAESEVDISGDGLAENIVVKGTLLEENESLYKNITIHISDPNGHNQKIDLEDGFKPKLTFRDLNRDGAQDILVAVPTHGSGGVSNYYLYTAKDFQVTDLTVPDPLVVQSQFLNGYKAKITIENNHKTYKFNLKNRAEDYESTGLYFQGKMNEPTELMIHAYSKLEPVKVRGKKVGLKGTQQISGAYDADVIGRIESTWVFQNGKWELLRTKVFETSYEKGKE
ncbi:hypothetical protein EKG37_06225 [Robertmurraya yapensis]|uniref:VCBS repeat-containing protein n=2 Tax=Bacillaceae TaxID=186817 RepID=A0A431WF86_9BACI|nr:hypothetical protein [Bacillus yapensis]RTR33817.1 hypothetical protein EKG37_06225 [Bacillus yapensis]TKS97135.1 hypothetical protein FAR12_06225 [Bacillus yapensis]